MEKSDLKKNYILERSGRTSFEELRVDETIFSLTNGSLGTRGHFIEGYGSGDYPQTLMNGFYNTYPFRYEENYKQFPQEGQTIVLLPDASYVKIEANEEVIDLEHAELVDLKRSLDMYQGLSMRDAMYRTPSGYEFLLHEEKHVLLKKQLIVVKISLSTTNYEGKIKLSSYLRMPISKANAFNDPRLPHARKHLTFNKISIDQNVALLKAQTTLTQLNVIAAITHDIDFDYQILDDLVIGINHSDISPNHNIEFTKYQAYATSIDSADLEKSIHDMTRSIRPFKVYLNEDNDEYHRFWKQNHLRITDNELQQALIYNTFQLNQSAGINYQTHIAAKGISGEGYEGHYFWDTEAYMLPFFILTQPKKAKELLLYRYYTLDQSRQEARNLGVKHGAKIAWRTINGKESSPYYPAGSAQIHINSDIALAVINYFYATLDDEFMLKYGFEMLLETARFILEYGHFKESQFHLDAVTGPDEYTAIVNDNYYTNSMAKAHLDFTFHYWTNHKEELQSLINHLGVNEFEIKNIKLAADQMTLLIDEKAKIIKQDSSFMNKKELDINSLPNNHFPLLLNYHPLFIYKHQVLKQADAVLSLVLLGEEDSRLYRNTYEYYLKRTTHDSSLSKCVYGIAAYHLGYDELAYQYFKEVAFLDLKNLKKHTQHGLHAANLGGSYLMLIYGIFGVRMGQVLSLEPAYQNQLNKTEIRFIYQGHHIKMTLDNQVLHLVTDLPIKLKVYGEIVAVDKDYKFGVKRLTR